MHLMPIEVTPRVLADFAGTWRLDRKITHGDGTQARFQGTAIWSGDETGLEYMEKGHLQMGQGPQMQAERRYHWGPDLDVHFDDGRFFHRVPALGGQTSHWCDPDTYDVTYDFTDWPCFTAIWQVHGPKKSYTLQSTYERN